MFERFTERARRVVFFARYEAGLNGRAAVAGDHLLLGLLRENGGEVARLLPQIGGGGLERQEGQEGSEGSQRADVGFSAEAQRMLAYAREEADRLGHHDVSTGHLLLGILRDAASHAAMLLTDRGARLEDARTALAAIHADQEPPPPLGAMRRPATGRPLRRPAHLPSSPGVRITPARDGDAGMASHAGEDYWLLEGFSLRAALARILRDDDRPFREPNIQWKAPVNSCEQYDIALLLGPGDRRQDRVRLMLRAIERRFDVSIVRESQLMDVYVLTALDGVRTPLKATSDFGGGFASMDVSFGRSPSSYSGATTFSDRIATFSSSAMTMDVFSRIMAEVLGRPVVNETHLAGTFDVELPAPAGTIDEFRTRLRSQLGLALTPDRRDVTVHVVRSAAS